MAKSVSAGCSICGGTGVVAPSPDIISGWPEPCPCVDRKAAYEAACKIIAGLVRHSEQAADLVCEVVGDDPALAQVLDHALNEGAEPA